MSDESWLMRAKSGDYLATPAATESFPMDWAIDGLLPATGATVWFGSGSTGKTQLLLWLSTNLAATGAKRPSHWLGKEIKVRGHVLVLTAEDLKEHVLQRIGSIARSIVAETGGTQEDVVSICDRIHVLAFLSMSNSEFKDPNPCLFGRGEGGRWEPTGTLNRIESFVHDWNANSDPDDQIVGVILDSAVSMAGFEMAHSEATTNFLFHINRVSRRQKVFWAIIGHTPKDAGKRVDDPAVERLRGSAMWSTTPRTVIEVRTAGPGDNTEEFRAAHPECDVRDVVYVSVAKANSQNADLRPRALRRVKDGAFVDITNQFPSLFLQPEKNGVPAYVEKASVVRPSDIDKAWNAVIELVEELTDGGVPKEHFTRTHLSERYQSRCATIPILREISGETDGKLSRTDYTLAWYLYQLRDCGAIVQKGHKFVIVDLNAARKKAEEPELAALTTEEG